MWGIRTTQFSHITEKDGEVQRPNLSHKANMFKFPSPSLTGFLSPALALSELYTVSKKNYEATYLKLCVLGFNVSSETLRE